jgi:hypothetical protein
MAKKKKKPTTGLNPLGMPPVETKSSEPAIDVEPVAPIEPEIEYVEPEPPDSRLTPPTTYQAPPTFREKYGKYVPSRKWGASTVGALGTVLIMWATTGTWDQEETVASITLGVTAVTAYLLKNASGDPNEQDFA